MKTHVMWGLVALVSVVAAVAVTWTVARNQPVPAATGQDAVEKPAKAKEEDSIKLVIAVAKSLAQFTTSNRASALVRMMEEAKLKTSGGKKIEVERVPMNTPEMIEALLSGTLKAHVIIPADAVYLDLLDREWTLRTGKAYTSERKTVIRQPYVLAVRRPMAEAMGWPKKDLGWPDVVEIARGGWKTVGHPEWGPLKMLLINPNYSDTGAHAAVSIALDVLRKGKTVNPKDLDDPALASAIKAIDGAVVWYPSSLDDLLRNEVLTVPPRCDMTFLAEHNILRLNERAIRRKVPSDWVAIYPAQGTIVDGVTAAVVERDWVTKEHREAANLFLQEAIKPETQKQLMALGYRPALETVALAGPFTQAAGVDPERPRQAFDMPPSEVIFDSLSAWDRVWKSRPAEVARPAVAGGPPSAASAPASMKKLAHLTPTIQCVRRAKPSTVIIMNAETGRVRGTGFIVDERGYAVTNSHVVGTEKVVSLAVMDSTDKVLKGEVAWNEPGQDLAIIRIQPPGKYTPMQFHDSDLPEVGESVVAIGNPLGYTGTVTVGIISALNRTITLPEGHVLKDVMQTDAGINPGNSGGPLLNLDGELVGIVFAVREGAQNIAFVIPAHRVRSFVKKCLPG